MVDVVDPVAEALPLLEKPHFTYVMGSAPDALDQLASRMRRADAYVTVTPEYNHAPSPALLNVLNHFPSSTFSFKPSAIVSYSAGQWGGTRAAHALRPVLSELGCLPVSAMCHIPTAGEAIDPEGVPTGAGARWDAYLGRCLSQLEWWARAANSQRELQDPLVASPPLKAGPSQRNSPR